MRDDPLSVNHIQGTRVGAMYLPLIGRTAGFTKITLLLPSSTKIAVLVRPTTPECREPTDNFSCEVQAFAKAVALPERMRSNWLLSSLLSIVHPDFEFKKVKAREIPLLMEFNTSLLRCGLRRNSERVPPVLSTLFLEKQLHTSGVTRASESTSSANAAQTRDLHISPQAWILRSPFAGSLRTADQSTTCSPGILCNPVGEASQASRSDIFSGCTRARNTVFSLLHCENMLCSALGRGIRSPSGWAIASSARARVNAVARPVGRKSSTNSTMASSTPPPPAAGPSEGGGSSRGRGAYKVMHEQQKQRVCCHRILFAGGLAPGLQSCETCSYDTCSPPRGRTYVCVRSLSWFALLR